MNTDLQLIALVLGCAGVLITLYRRARGETPMIVTPYQAQHFIGGSAILSIVMITAVLILLAGCSPYVDAPRATPTAVTTVTPQRITPSPRPPTSTATPLPSCRVRTGIPDGRVNLRTGAGVSYAVVRVLREGELLKVLQRAAWLKVRTAGGNTGFIYARYCR